MTKAMIDVLDCIPEGKKNAISRRELCASAGYSDRKLRNIIADLREEGYMIINDQTGKGYYITDDLDEIEQQYKQEYSRALKTLKRLKHMRTILKLKGRTV